MFEIYHTDTKETAAIITVDPFGYRIEPGAGPAVRSALNAMKSAGQMNRTEATEENPFVEGDGPAGNVPTSMEGRQDPSGDYILNKLDRTLRPAYRIAAMDSRTQDVESEVRAMGHRLEAADYSEGQEVDTPDGMGVVVEIRTEPFEGPSGDDVDASDDNPAYVVGVESGAAVFRDSDLSAGTIDVDGVDDPSGELGANAEAMLADVTPDTLQAAGDDGRQFDYPDSWDESPTPNRIILLKAWAGLGGRFTTCRRKMAGDVASPARFCASMKDRVLLWEGWRQ